MDDNGAPSAAKRTGNRVTKALVQAVDASVVVVMMMRAAARVFVCARVCRERVRGGKCM